MGRSIGIEAILNSIKELSFSLEGQKSITSVDSVKPLDEANTNSLAWVKYSGDKAVQLLELTKASLIICSDTLSLPEHLLKSKLFVKVGNPKLAVSLIIKNHFEKKVTPGVHPTAFVHPNATLGKDVYIGPFTYVGECIIGDGSIIWGNCYIHDNVTIKKQVEIHAGCVIGDIGSGYAKNEANEWVKFPHIGGLILEDNVEVGALSYINRGALSNTKIGKGVKIGNAVCIGHNVQIGEDSIVIANTVIAGSTKVGKNAYIAHSSTLRNGIKVGDNAFIGMGAVVTKNVVENTTVLGNPAEELNQFKSWMQVRKSILDKNEI